MRTRFQVRASEAAAFVSVCALTVAVAADSGGFFARTWGWATICLSAVAASSLVLLGGVGVGGLAAAALALLVCVDAWTALSAFWSPVPADSLREAERGLVYVSALLAGLVLGRAGRSAVVAGVAVSAGGVAAYGLATRLFPSRPAVFQPVEGTLLIDPLGYANALGLLAAIGILLFLVFAVHARVATTRSLAAAAVIVLLPALVLTSSRGSWIALWAGLLVLLLLDPLRSRLLVAACAVAPAAAVVVWLTVRSPALTDKEATLQEAIRAGRRLAVAIALLAIVAGAAVLAGERLRLDTWRLARPRSLVALIAVMALVLAGFGALALPGHLGDRPGYWRVAWSEFEHHASLGSGAGTFGRYWRAAHPLGLGALDAHSLYLETLAELGPVGLVLLVAALAVPLVQGWRSRAAPFVAGATAAYTAYVVHAAFDWDWEMPAVTIVALFCAGVLFAVDDRADNARQRHTLLVLALLLGALGLATGIANSRLGA
jgi:hypothetical protein